MKTKTCIDCQKRKSVDAFYRVFKDSEHRQSRCKPCDNRKRTGGYKRNGDGSRRTIVERMADGSLVMSRVARSGSVNMTADHTVRRRCPGCGVGTDAKYGPIVTGSSVLGYEILLGRHHEKRCPHYRAGELASLPEGDGRP